MSPLAQSLGSAHLMGLDSSVPVSEYSRPLAVQKFRPRAYISTQRYSVWQIDSGFVRTSTYTEDGAMISLGFWGQGDMVGRHLSQMEPLQIECLTDVVASAFFSAACSPRVFLAHIEQTEDLLRIMHIGAMGRRLRQFLLWLAHRFGQATCEAWLIPFRLTHQDIADAIGTTRVTVTRLLSQLEREGLLAWSGKRQILLKSSLETQQS